MHPIRSIFTSFLFGSFGVACNGHQPPDASIFSDRFQTNYLRDVDKNPLKERESGEETNSEKGKCNYFNYRFKKSGGSRQYREAYPIHIMQHHTVGDLTSTTALFTNNRAPLSAHYVVDKDGTMYHFVGDTYRAYHAGLGSLGESSMLNPSLPYAVLQNDMNSWSIGIENVNNGNEPYTEAQIESNLLLCQYLAETHKTIDPKLMLGHSDWSPGRKIDPNPYFPWNTFADAQDAPSLAGPEMRQNFGIYPRKKDLIISTDPDILIPYKEKGSKCSEEEQVWIEKLRAYGYDLPNHETYDASIQKAILAFKLHHSNDDILSRDATRGAWEQIYRGNHSNLLYVLNANDGKYIDDLLDQSTK